MHKCAHHRASAERIRRQLKSPDAANPPHVFTQSTAWNQTGTERQSVTKWQRMAPPHKSLLDVKKPPA
jgi:hypothetical protein